MEFCSMDHIFLNSVTTQYIIFNRV